MLMWITFARLVSDLPANRILVRDGGQRVDQGVERRLLISEGVLGGTRWL